MGSEMCIRDSANTEWARLYDKLRLAGGVIKYNLFMLTILFYPPKLKNFITQNFNDIIDNIMKQKNLIINNLDLKKNSVLNQDLEPILEMSLKHIDMSKGGYKGAPKFPTFNLYETLIYFYNKSKDNRYLEPVNLILKQLCSKIDL